MTHSKKKYFLTLAVVTALLNTGYAGIAFAEEAESQAQSEQIQTRDVVVTASRTEQLVKETPSAVEVVTREDLDKMGADTLEQALQLAVGIDVSEKSGVSATNMVGNAVSIRGANSNQTLIMVDGMRIRTENTAELANSYELQRINMADVERIEIVRGATSSLYGADAMGGVINIITKTPDKASTSVFADYTTRQADAGFRVATGLQGKWASSFSYKRSNVHHIDVNGSSPQYGTKDYFNLKTKYKIDDKKSLGFFVDYMKEDLDFDKDVTSYDHDRTKFGISYDGKDKKGKYQLRVNYSIFNKDQNTRKNGVLTRWDEIKFHTLTIDGQRSYQLNESNLLTVGGEVRREQYEGTRIGLGGDNVHTVTRDGISQDYSENTTTYTAAYIQDEWQVDDNWLMIPSLRYDHNTAFGSKVTYKLGNTYKLSDQTRLKFNLGTAYRAPTEAELYMDWNHTPVSTSRMQTNVHVTGNPNLKPETSYNFDFGIEAESKSGKTKSKLTYFHSKFDDLINSQSTTRFIPGRPMIFNIESQYVNVDSAEIQGTEAEFTQKLGRNFTLRTTYTYTDAKDGYGARLEGRDRHKLSLQLSYNDAKTGWSGSVWNDWHGDYWADNEFGEKSNNNASILNCVVSKKIGKGSSAYLGVNNIMGKDDANSVTVFGLTGRVWRAGVNWNF